MSWARNLFLALEVLNEEMNPAAKDNCNAKIKIDDFILLVLTKLRDNSEQQWTAVLITDKITTMHS